ncbi:hypothetical protein HDU91_005017 [Kappamyces sp. JEL0680]|nr:hypothetical protein HDU91_005017 [Kappamyces sp. JEL0680]
MKNEKIIHELGILADVYGAEGRQREVSYRADALQVPFVGPKIASKICEILKLGHADAEPLTEAEQQLAQEAFSTDEDRSQPVVPYRFELSKSGRALCKHCGSLIPKGEPKLVVHFMIHGHDAYTGRHLQCVTPIEVLHMKQRLEGIEKVPGWELLSEKQQKSLVNLDLQLLWVDILGFCVCWGSEEHLWDYVRRFHHNHHYNLDHYDYDDHYDHNHNDNGQIDRVFVIVFENENQNTVMADSYFGTTLPAKGRLLTNYHAATHPSQGNYVAMITGGLQGVTGDGTYNLNAKSVVDLLEAKGVSWKTYQEDYTGTCNKAATIGGSGKYARKHNPFISMTNIQSSPARCAKIVPATQLKADIAAQTVPSYVFYTPNMVNDGHDSSVSTSSSYLKGLLEPMLADAYFGNTVFLITYDENDAFSDSTGT